ncbi:MAG: hypothetical protein ACD_36C00152G0003 [uncultured bacterium]|uniref:LUD domain-containing protein n=1 Tax=Candidatus Gottesmanbacteria bacterium RIFCSPLOWO2_01_FULL_43_11b TaxID=1798392 RepID=A0A1F6AHE5_9BACT|nr:MAG: hypothetical protein ACD_36C00152G0003 [uncultured bacterium]OGG24144.1 MAG: hypothetical protein A3A79_03055 [Candidatus Gottesmanbacteria bacterium RIFCSPLOWO2_01_FULL_43_11b]
MVLQKTISALESKGYTVIVVKNGKEALEYIKKIIPQGASVMNGSSVTLEQIGYETYLGSGNHGWVDLHAKVNAESDREKRRKLRRESVLSDYYVGSVHALIQTGEFVMASNSGSQLPHIVFTSHNLLFVVSTKKIVPTLDEGMKRVREYVFPLEDTHMKEKYGVGTGLNKILIFRGEMPASGRKITFLLVEENLGF